MKVASFNVNSVNARIEVLLSWLNYRKPDVVLLQEIKCTDDNFPYLDFSTIGYESAVFGQKSYNGVAILSKFPISNIKRKFYFDYKITNTSKNSQVNDFKLDGQTMVKQQIKNKLVDFQQARYIEANICNRTFASVYVPNGNPLDSPKFYYKLKWLDNLTDYIDKNFLKPNNPICLGGDFNIVFNKYDANNYEKWKKDAIGHIKVKKKINKLLNLGLFDAYKMYKPKQRHAFTFWDYKAGSWQRDHGLRLDLFLLSSQFLDKMVSCEVDKFPRSQKKPSDHTALILNIKNNFIS